MLVFIYKLEMDILEWFYKIGNSFLNVFFYIISQFGGSLILLLTVSVIYWTINKEKAEKIALTVLSAVCLNNFLKSIFSFNRPFMYDGYEHLQKLKNSKLSDSSTGSSFPSGHSQITGSLYSSICFYFPKKQVIFPSIILMILIPISRLYLGVHFPSDVIVGLLIGIIVALIYYILLKKFPNKFNLIAIISILIYLPMLFFKNVEYDFCRSYGLLIGFFLGRLIESKYINFTTEVPLKNKILRLILGILIIGITYFLIKLIPNNISHHFIMAVLLHSIITFMVATIVPLLFKSKRNKNGI